MGGIGYFSRYRVSRKQAIHADNCRCVGCSCVCASFVYVLSNMASKSIETHTGTSKIDSLVCIISQTLSIFHQELAFLTLILQPALLLIDFGHFQYNSVMLGILQLFFSFFTMDGERSCLVRQALRSLLSTSSLLDKISSAHSSLFSALDSSKWPYTMHL